MVKVLVVGYGVIGQRLADGVSMQADMELVGVVDVAPTLSVRALKKAGMPYKLYAAYEGAKTDLESAGIPVEGLMEDALKAGVDVVLDATTHKSGIGAKNKEMYKKYGAKAIFQGGEATEVADVFFHGCVNYNEGVGKDFLKLTSCNTTGLLRVVGCLDDAVGVEKVALTIVRRVADPGDYHRGLTNAVLVEKAPNHQALDMMEIMPHIDATGYVVHSPSTHGHFISIVLTPKEDITIEEAIKAFNDHSRIQVISDEDGFLGNASVFRFARDSGQPKADFYETGVWKQTLVKSGRDLMFGIHIPQESITIPETIDGVRAVMGMQTDGKEAIELTNKYLNMGEWL